MGKPPSWEWGTSVQPRHDLHPPPTRFTFSAIGVNALTGLCGDGEGHHGTSEARIDECETARGDAGCQGRRSGGALHFAPDLISRLAVKDADAVTFTLALAEVRAVSTRRVITNTAVELTLEDGGVILLLAVLGTRRLAARIEAQVSAVASQRP